MTEPAPIFLGIDCGATTSKFNGIDAEGQLLSEKLRQIRTPSSEGPEAMLQAWLAGLNHFLEDESLHWDQVASIGIAMPGPYLSYGVLGKMPNMADEVEGWKYLNDLSQALERSQGRTIPVHTANDGQLAGVPEAHLHQQELPGSVLMLAPGSGLGCSFVNAEGQLLTGDHHAAVILGHIPFPYEELGLPRFSCGCGRTWGCIEAYTSISGLSQYLEFLLPRYPDHPLHEDARTRKEQALSLRDFAMQQDPLACEIFDLQAQAMGHAVSIGCMCYDPTHVVIGGGLMDPEATSEVFRTRYLQRVRESAELNLWTRPSELHIHEAKLGEHAQAMGAALLAQRMTSRRASA